jgi:hypothetical protein
MELRNVSQIDDEIRLLLYCGVDWHTQNQHDSDAGYHAWAA